MWNKYNFGFIFIKNFLKRISQINWIISDFFISFYWLKCVWVVMERVRGRRAGGVGVFGSDVTCWLKLFCYCCTCWYKSTCLSSVTRLRHYGYSCACEVYNKYTRRRNTRPPPMYKDVVTRSHKQNLKLI